MEGHRGFITGVSIVYFLLVAFAYKEECLELLEREGGIGSWKIILLFCIALVFLAGLSALVFL